MPKNAASTSDQEKRLKDVELYVRENKYSETVSESEKNGIRNTAKKFEIIGMFALVKY